MINHDFSEKNSFGQETFIGSRTIRVDSREKVTGQALYPADYYLPGMIYGRVLRSPHPHARIKSIDLSAARALPGVICAVCGDDLPEPGKYGLVFADQSPLARTGGKVRYVGDGVAALAAENPQIAEAALSLIKVEYEQLPVINDVHAALIPGAVLVHEDRPDNILHSLQLHHGDINAGFAEADLIIENTYTTPLVDHAVLQPEAGLAYVDADSRINLFVATQWADEDRRQISEALGIPREQIREVVTSIGGAFGRREDISVQIILCLLAIKSGRPVKLVYSRSESILACTKRHPFEMVYRTGVSRNGKLTAMQIDLLANAGAYASTSLVVLNTAITLATGAYEVPNVSINARVVHTNSPVTAAFRGFGSNQPNFAVEMEMNKLADKLHMDPGEFRRLNLLRTGSLMHTGQVLEGGVGALQSLDAALERAKISGLHWKQNQHAGSKFRGVGVACGCKNIGYSLGWDDHADAVVEAWPDHAVVKTGVCDVGQGSNTVWTQIVASRLGLPIEAVSVARNDSDIVPDSGSSSASRQTFVTGNAVLKAADLAAQKLKALGPTPKNSDFPVVSSFTYHAPTTYPLDPLNGQSQRPNYGYGFGAQVIEVEVDTDTGYVEVLQVIAAHDVGKAINLSNVEGQIEGGYLMSQGYSLIEDYPLVNGRPKATTLAAYLIPTALDAPRIDPVVVEEPDLYGPLGAKGVGEMTMLPTPGAIAAAIHDAVDVWINELPMSPERVLHALGKI
ncbi:MAG: xanthine dehydrogenase family protein molybdopterin-binding subunit [Anaerolineae bacterium]|nr:xanthine dehydrogenase family protein molybdopterin-binding subunit [Anaerolineae bacterium]